MESEGREGKEGRSVPEDGEQDVDQQVGAAASDDEDTHGWDWRELV